MDAGQASLGELLLRLRHEAGLFLESELAFLRAEAHYRGRELGRGLVPALVGAAMMAAALAALLAACILGLGELLGGRYALSAFLIGGAALFLGLGLLFAGVRTLRRAVEVEPQPELPPSFPHYDIEEHR